MSKKPTDIQPTEIEPTSIQPTNIKPTKIEPTDISPTEVKPTKIEPTDINPTDIKPTEIKPTDIGSPQNQNAPKKGQVIKGQARPFSSKMAATYLTIALAGGISTLVVGLLVGLSFGIVPIILATLGALFAFFAEMKKLKITQEQLDEWNNEILKKHPNFNKNQLMKLEDTEKSLNKVSFWTHTLKNPLLKISTWLTLTFSVASLGLGVILPLATGGGIAGGGSGNVVGVYVQAAQHETKNNISQVGRTAWKFDSNGNAFFTGYYNGSSSSWQSYGKYTKSGSRVTISGIGGAYFNIKNSGKALSGSDGSYWIKV